MYVRRLSSIQNIIKNIISKFNWLSTLSLSDNVNSFSIYFVKYVCFVNKSHLQNNVTTKNQENKNPNHHEVAA